MEASRLTTFCRKGSIVSGWSDLTASDPEICLASRSAFRIAASCTRWKSETKSEGRKCLACATSSSSEMLVVLPCSYCSVTKFFGRRLYRLLDYRPIRMQAFR